MQPGNSQPSLAGGWGTRGLIVGSSSSQLSGLPLMPHVRTDAASAHGHDSGMTSAVGRHSKGAHSGSGVLAPSTPQRRQRTSSPIRQPAAYDFGGATASATGGGTDHYAIHESMLDDFRSSYLGSGAAPQDGTAQATAPSWQQDADTYLCGASGTAACRSRLQEPWQPRWQQEEQPPLTQQQLHDLSARNIGGYGGSGSGPAWQPHGGDSAAADAGDPHNCSRGSAEFVTPAIIAAAARGFVPAGTLPMAPAQLPPPPPLPLPPPPPPPQPPQQQPQPQQPQQQVWGGVPHISSLQLSRPQQEMQPDQYLQQLRYEPDQCGAWQQQRDMHPQPRFSDPLARWPEGAPQQQQQFGQLQAAADAAAQVQAAIGEGQLLQQCLSAGGRRRFAAAHRPQVRTSQMIMGSTTRASAAMISCC